MDAANPSTLLLVQPREAHRWAIYASDPEWFPLLDALWYSPAQFETCEDVTAAIQAKQDFLDAAPRVLIDLTGIGNMSGMSFTTGAILRVLEGTLKQLVVIGISLDELQALTPDEEERDALVAATTRGALQVFRGRANWLNGRA